jgi:hypothetical protein
MTTRRTSTAKRTTRTAARGKGAAATRRTAAGRSTATRRKAGTSRTKTAGRATARGTTARRTGAATTRGRAPARATSIRPTNGYGSIFRMIVRPGMKDQLKKLMTQQRSQRLAGVVSTHLFDTGGDEIWGVAVFKNEKAYRDNANSPDQNARYQEFRALLEFDPEWHDANIMSFQ